MSKTGLGHCVKITAAPKYQQEIKQFYLDVLGCQQEETSYENIDLFRCPNNSLIGVYYTDEALTPEQHLNATWLEIRSSDVVAVKQRILDFGLQEMDFGPSEEFFFQVPGGQVYRLVDFNY